MFSFVTQDGLIVKSSNDVPKTNYNNAHVFVLFVYLGGVLKL